MPPETERHIVANCRRAKIPIPDKIRDKPTLNIGLELYFEAFYALCSTKQLGFGTLGPISWLAVQKYIEVCRFDEYQARVLHLAVPLMDAVQTEYASKNQPRKDVR